MLKTTFPLTTGQLVQPTFFAHDQKLAFKQTGDPVNPTILYIWDLDKNIINQISSEETTDVGKNLDGVLYSGQDGHLYLQKEKKLILVQ